MKKFILALSLSFIIASCSENELEKKGFQVSEISEDESGQKIVDPKSDTLELETRPRNVLLTYHPQHRLTPIYKVNYNKKTKKPFVGSNAFHSTWGNDRGQGNNWNHNFMPGFEAVYGYNFINVSYFNNESQRANTFFEEPVLIKTLYYPAFSKDTLNFKAVVRNYYMVSVYDEDTNGDGFVNVKDLRRFYYMDIEGQNKRVLVPKNYSVLSSEYDSANDFMYIFAKKDTNENGQMDADEPTDIFWIDLGNPENVGEQYISE